MGAYRWVYNKCVEITIKVRDFKFDGLSLGNHFGRNHVEGIPAWLKEIPTEIRKQACLEFDKNLRAEKKKVATGINSRFGMKFKSCKDRNQTISGIPFKAVKLDEASQTLKIYATYMEVPDGVAETKEIKEKMKTLRVRGGKKEFAHLLANKSDWKLTADRLGHFEIIAVIEIPRPVHTASPSDNQADVVALDPGNDHFGGFYSPSGIAGRLLYKDVGRIKQLCEQIDKLQGVIDTAPRGREFKRYRYKLRRAFRRACARIRNLVTDAHWQAIHWLTTNFRGVVTSWFNSSEMCARVNSRGRRRRLRKKTARSLMTWSHYSFRQRLQSKAEERGCFVDVIEEQYTTKVKTCCGVETKTKLSDRWITCPNCGTKYHRDVGSGRNIFLKWHFHHI
jgi:transposase